MPFSLLIKWFRFAGIVIMVHGLGGLSACQENLVEPAYFGTITGTVLDARTNLPIANASVTTNPATSSYMTSTTGKFSIDNVPAGRVAITVSKADYTQVAVNVTVLNGQAADVSVILTKSSTVPPSVPLRPNPASGATGQPTDVVLGWRPNAAKSDSLRYDVILFESNNLNQRNLVTNSKDTTIQATSLLYNTTYYWQITVRNTAGVSARSPVWSFQTRALPDNRYLFARTVAGNTDIYSSDATGASLVRLTSSAFTEIAPQLSPNRDLVAFTSNASGNYQLYTMNRDGSNQRRITTLAVEGFNNFGVGFRWSPDGAQLIYSSYDQLYRINRDGTGLTQLATAPTGRNFRECDWTAQGNRIVVQTIGVNAFDSEFYLLNANGGGLTLLVGNLPGRLDSPSFNFDGSRVMYTRDITGTNDIMGRQFDSHVFTQRLDGSDLVDVSGSTTAGNSTGKGIGTNDLYPRYSPDGFHIIFVNTANDDRSSPDIWTAESDGRSRARLIQNGTMPDWK